MKVVTWNCAALEELRQLEPLLDRHARDLALVGLTGKAAEWKQRWRSVQRLIAVAPPPPGRPPEAA